MFALHTSNRAENLLSHLAQVVESQPLDSPFEQELFLIQSQGMERWLSQQLATKFGVWGNYRFYFPGNFVSEISAPFVNSSTATNYQREQMVWIIEQLLRTIEAEQSEPFQIVTDYIQGANSGVRRFQLAQQLARIFDQYQMMRPDWLRAWSSGRLIGESHTEQWQSELWRRINSKFGDCHRGELWERAIREIERTSPAALRALLPRRISIFGLNTIPPLLLNLLRALGRQVDIHLYLLTPTREYWGEGGSRRVQIEQSLSDDSMAIDDHRLLLSLGEQAREFQRLLLEQVEFSHEFSSYEPNTGDGCSLLNRLQNDLLANSSGVQGIAKDGSIAIHSCHSRLREVEVLHDQILDLLDKDPDLELREIVVMSPDIQNYAPHIKVIFGDLSHAIADRTLREDSEVLDNTLQFLKVSRGRFGWQEVMDLLEKPAIHPAFGLTEKDLQLIRHWIGEVNIRWGLSGAHRMEQGLPEFAAFSWQAGLERLMMGYATGECDELVDGILPYAEVEGSSAQALGGLYRFIAILAEAHSEFKRPTSLRRWAQRISHYSALLFERSCAEEMGLTNLNALLEQLTDELGRLHSGDVDIEVIEQWIKDSLSERKSSNGFLRGQLTFCSMLPMRAIPFKVIALLGMNEGEYPRVIQPYTFDLMGSDHRIGDRSTRNDDRAQFLETLLSARERLIITYIGQSIQDNSEISPSAVVSELIDLLELTYQQSEVVTRHPLQPFNHQYYACRDAGNEREKGHGSVACRDAGNEREKGHGSVACRDVGNERENDCKEAGGRATHGAVAEGFESIESSPQLFSYSERYAQTARLLMAERGRAEPWWQGSIEPHSSTVIELPSLFKFFRDPQSHFVEAGLGLRFLERAPESAERERFDIEPLENYIISQQLVEHLYKHGNVPDTPLLVHEGWWIGAAGEIEYEKRVRTIEPFVEKIRALNLGGRLEALDIDIEVGRYRVVGQLAHHYDGGTLSAKDALLYRYGRMKGSDLIKGWLYHLLANRVSPVSTTVVTEDRQLQFLPQMIESQHLEQWLDLYHTGQSEPSALFVEPAFAYLKQLTIKSRKSPIDAARSQLHHELSKEYNAALITLYGGVEDVDELISEPFAALCEELLVPVWREVS